MFQKIAKHRANDASNDVHRPPLFPQHLPPWYDDILSNSINRTHLRTRDPRFSETVRLGYLHKLIAYSILNTGQLTCLHWQLDDSISSHVQGVPKKESAGATLHLPIIPS